LLNTFIYKDSERGEEKNPRVVLPLRHHWNLIFFQTLPATTNYHSKLHLLTIDTMTLLSLNTLIGFQIFYQKNGRVSNG